MKIIKNTPLTLIREWMKDDFDLSITTAQAEEIKDSVLSGAATWTTAGYRSARNTDDVRQANADGVRYYAYNIFYDTDAWNAAVEEGRV